VAKKSWLVMRGKEKGEGISLSSWKATISHSQMQKKNGKRAIRQDQT